MFLVIGRTLSLFLVTYLKKKKKKKTTLFIFLGDRTLTAEPVEVIVYLLKY